MAQPKGSSRIICEGAPVSREREKEREEGRTEKERSRLIHGSFLRFYRSSDNNNPRISLYAHNK